MLVNSFDKMTLEKRTAHIQNEELYLEKLIVKPLTSNHIL